MELLLRKDWNQRVERLSQQLPTAKMAVEFKFTKCYGLYPSH